MPANSNLDNALAVAVPRWANEFRDNVVNVAPFIRAWNRLGGVRYEPGGSEIILPIRYQGITIGVVTNPVDPAYDVMSQDDTISGASYQWAELYGAITLAERELNKLRNDPRRLGMYVREVTRGGIEDFGRFVNQQVLSNTDTGDASKLGGLPYYVSDYATAVGSYANNTAKPLGGITNSSQTHFWNARVASGVGAISFSVLDSHLAALFATTGRTPPLAVMPADLYSKLRSSAQTVQALNQQGGKAVIGFNAIAYGDTLIIPDNACPAGSVLLLDPETIMLYFDQREVSAERVPVRQPVRFWKLIWHTQLVCSGRKYNAKLLGVTT